MNENIGNFSREMEIMFMKRKFQNINKNFRKNIMFEIKIFFG